MGTELTLAESLNQLHQLRLAALAGKHYDPDEFDEAVIRFRRAWEHAERVRAVDQLGVYQSRERRVV